MNNRLIKSNDAGGGGACTNTVDNYNPFPDGGGVALYQLNGDATDVSGNYDGTASNVTYGAGQFGQAGVFNGSTSLILNSSFNAITGNAARSYNGWVYTNGSTEGAIFSTGEWGVAGRSMGLWFNQSSGQFYVQGYSASHDVNLGTLPNLSNGWHMFTLTWDAINTFNIYIDGQLFTSATKSATYNTTPYLSIGEWYNATLGVYHFNNSIDQVRIFSRALRPYEVEALYTEEYCTPTIVPSEHFNTVTWTSTGDTDISITGVGFQPDLVWAKARTDAYSHTLYDSVRGAGSSHMLSSNLTNSESSLATDASQYGYLGSFDIDGFTGNAGTSDNSYFNYNTGKEYVAWNFKAGGEAVENTNGTITSQVSANVEAGFSIVTWTDSFATGQTVGHGLGQSPKIIMARTLDRASNLWYVSHPEDNTKSLILSSNAAQNSDLTWVKEDDTFGANWTGTSFRWLAYCFAEVEGFSSFGSYVGTGASGNTVVTGFEPAFVMVKRTDGTGVWVMLDNKRNLTNPKNSSLYANTSAQEDTGSTSGFYPMNFYENGFEPIQNTGDYNASGGEYIYMAFAADPTTVEPSLEDSFNTVVYDGTGAPQSITDVGFQPDFVWIKGRTDSADYHNLFDSVRGADKVLISNLTNAEYDGGGSAYLPSFDIDGFSLSGNSIVNGVGTENYVAWNWKGAELPAINSNGSIPSVVSANPAAGFSIVSYTGNGANGDTVGHGLSAVPNVVIWKNRSDARNWVVWHSGLTSIDYSLILNSTSAEVLDSRTNRPFGQPTDSVLVLGEDNETNFSANKFIAYCFAEVAGFSKFGSYTGTGGSTTVSGFGFEPAFLLIKRTDTNGSWVLQDNARGAGKSLFPDLSAAESLGWQTTFNSDGFNTTSGEAWINANGGTYIYMAFANQF